VDGGSAGVPGAGGTVPRAGARRGSGRARGGGGLGVELTVLGSSAAYPAAGGAASGYLLRHDGFNLWIDAGTGTLSNIQKYVAHYEVDAVLISHEHPDHCVDLYPLFIARTFHPDDIPKLPVYGPAGVFGRVSGLERDGDGGRLSDVFDMRSVEPGE